MMRLVNCLVLVERGKFSTVLAMSKTTLDISMHYNNDDFFYSVEIQTDSNKISTDRAPQRVCMRGVVGVSGFEAGEIAANAAARTCAALATRTPPLHFHYHLNKKK